MLATLTSVWLLHAAALVTPGPNVLLVSQLAAGDRMRSGVFASLGISLVALMWSTAAVLGVNALFAVFPGVRLALQVAGALYLLYVASRLWRAGAAHHEVRARSLSGPAAFRLGFFTNATNAKSALFFGSIFSAAFPAQPSPSLLAAAVLMVTCNALLWHMLLAFLFSRDRIRAAYASKSRLLNRFAGTALGAIGFNLLILSLRQLSPRQA